MDCRKILFLLCIVGCCFSKECSRLNFTTKALMGYYSSNNAEIRNTESLRDLYCRGIDKNPSLAVNYRPESIDIHSSSIKSSLHFEQIDTSAVVYIQIVRSGIETIDADTFKKMRNTLVSANIYSNTLSKLSQNAFNYLNNLKVLILQNNFINVIEKDFLKVTNHLEHLDLTNNSIINVPHFDNCHNLRYLSLDLNNIEEFPEINHCKNLLSVHISHNTLQSFPNEILKTQNLTYLDISYNNITNISTYDLQNLKKLEILYINSNPLFNSIEIPINLFQNNLLLKTLNLEATELETIQIGIFSRLNKLYYLNLGWNKLTYIPSGTFNDLSSLKGLNLHHNKLTIIQSPLVFFGLHKLETLNLSYNNLKYIASDIFNNLKSLNFLNLQNNQLYFIHSIGIPNKLKRLNLDGNLFGCEMLLTFPQIVKDMLDNGQSYNTTNVKGIKCNPEIINLPFSSLENLIDSRNSPKHILNQNQNTFSNKINLKEIEDYFVSKNISLQEIREVLCNFR